MNPVNAHDNGSSLSLSNANSQTKNSSTSNLSLSSNIDPFYGLSFKVGVAENKNTAYRSKMEDVHTYVANFAERLDWGYFAIFDGHAGKQTARWCGNNLHTLLEQEIIANEEKFQSQARKDGGKNEVLAAVREVDMKDNLFNSFVKADTLISKEGTGNSGSTAAVVVLAWESNDANSKEPHPSRSNSTTKSNSNDETPNLNGEASFDSQNQDTRETKPNGEDSGARILSETPDPTIDYSNYKRMLYTANVGDLRIVLFRDGKSYRLSYDHKASDPNEINRIRDSGGLIMKNRVNGILSVTRSLGDTYMKDLVVGKPFTTSTEITDKDEFMILACDGLWDVISDYKACGIVEESFKVNEDPEYAAKRLCQVAMDHATTDNITVMVVKLASAAFKPS